MIDVLSVDNMRRSDAATIEAGTPGRDLMMRAARGVFDCVGERTGWKAPVAIVCGSGNNAGDGYALALILKDNGMDPVVICVYDRFSEDGKYYYDKCALAGIRTVMWADAVKSQQDPLKGYKTVVDCLLGTGFSGPVRPELESVINAINDSSAYTVSVDINSGLNGDTGMGTVAVRSDLTVSVGSFKPGHFLNMAKDLMADKVNVDIGIEPADTPYHLIESSDIKELIGVRPNFSNKGTYGYTALIGGSLRYSGAIRLAYLAHAASRSGAGVVKTAVPRSIASDVAGRILEETIFPLGDDGDGNVVYVKEEIDELISNVKTVAFGMGIGTSPEAAHILEHFLGSYKGTLIVDADGLTLLSRLDKSVITGRSCDLILTPHIKEFSRLTGSTTDEILSDPVGKACQYAAGVRCTVLLKGPSTIITDGGRVFLTDRGCPGMATAGSGDVLSGIIAATAAYIEDKCLAAAAAAYINGAAGELASEKFGDVSMLAGDTVSNISEVIKNL